MARFCLTPRCSEVVAGRDSYCDGHRPKREPWAGSHSRASTRAWRRLRASVLRRDGHKCRGCGAYATEVDAIVAAAFGGSHEDPANLQALCETCHKTKTDEDRREGVRRAAARKG
jgi:5-methylcytosine-specific restriction enzyme A